MPNPSESGRGYVGSPVDLIAGALDAASKGESYYDTHSSREAFNDELIRGLGLDTPEPDGKPLMNRLVDSSGVIGRLNKLRKVAKSMKGAVALIEDGMDGVTNPVQEELGVDLSTMAVRQFDREGSICPGVTSLLLAAPERYSDEGAGLKARVFEGEVKQVAEEYGARSEDARVLTETVLSAVGIKSVAETGEPVSLFVPDRSKGVLYHLDFNSGSGIGERERAKSLSLATAALPVLMIQGPTDRAPRNFVPQVRTRRR